MNKITNSIRVSGVTTPDLVYHWIDNCEFHKRRILQKQSLPQKYAFRRYINLVVHSNML